MNIKITIASICASLLSLPISASPVEYDTPDAHIIVMRSIDSWSGDNGASEDSLEAAEARKCAFTLTTPKGEMLGHPLLFQGISDNPIIQSVNSALQKSGFELVNTLKFRFKVGAPASMSPTEYGLIVKRQRDLFKYLVISQGNPATLPSRVSSKKFWGAVLSLGTVAVAGEKFGALGSQVTLNSGIAGDVYQLSASSSAALSPIALPHFDASGYKSIDVRRVIQGNNDRLGQVIIAYKNDKTDDVENTALIKAIVTLTGADTTVEAIKQARAEDLAERQAIWDACVVEGKCKNE